MKWSEPEAPTEFRMLDIVFLAFAALAIMVASDLIKTHWIAGFMPSFPTILIVTTLALILAQFRSSDGCRGPSRWAISRSTSSSAPWAR